MSTEVEGSVEDIICQSCSSVIAADEKFCGECGATVKEDYSEEDDSQTASEEQPRTRKKSMSVSKSNRKRAASLSKERLAKRKVQVKQDAIKGGRIAIMAVAIITFLYTLWQYVAFNGQVADARNNPMMIVDEKIVSQTTMILMASFAASFLFLGFFFWAKSNPFSACLSALIIYILSHIVAAVFDPMTIIQGIIIKIIIIAALVKAVAKAAELRAIEQEESS